MKQTIIIGRLGNSPFLCHGNLTDFTTFTLWSTILKEGEETVVSKQIWAYGKQAKLVCDHVKKGDLCCVEGKVEEKGIVCERITFLSKRRLENE